MINRFFKPNVSKLKDKKGILSLIKCLKSRNLCLSAEAATTLASLGRTDPLIARRAIPVLEEIFD